MRIISGDFKGRKLIDSKDFKSLKPTTNRNREALFNILNSAKFIKEIDFILKDSNILDVCAGSGSISFEAISHGVKNAVLIEKNIEHIHLIKQNIKLLKVEDKIKILNSDAKNLPQNDQFFNLIFIDPPYEEDYQKITNSLLKSKWIVKDSLVVFESSQNLSPDFLTKFKILDNKKYGKTRFIFCKLV